MTTPDEGQFADWLETQLRARRMSLRQLADRSGVNASTVSRILHGKRRPSLRTALLLSRALEPARPPGGLELPITLVHGDLDPVATVERALRADFQLTDAAVHRLMILYHTLRTERPQSVITARDRRPLAAAARGRRG
jgi:transcriptional regulator with XRE-family HTH domain